MRVPRAKQERGLVRVTRLLVVSMKEDGLSTGFVLAGHGPRVGWWWRAALMSLSPQRRGD
jgi:hypothetical protein